jgi:hypothetical protein
MHHEVAIAELGSRSAGIQADGSSSGSVIGFVGMAAIPRGDRSDVHEI